MEERSGNGGEKWEWRREVGNGFIYMNIVCLLATIMAIVHSAKQHVKSLSVQHLATTNSSISTCS